MFRIGIIGEFNDPFDCAPSVVSEVPDLASRCDAIEAEMLRLRSESFGVVCFSTENDNPLMWSHYADNHRGLALVIEKEDQNDLYPIEYTKERVVLKADDFLSGDYNYDKMKQSLTRKSEDWKYEQEVRLLYMLEDCSLADGNYFKEFAPALIKGVILGARCKILPSYIRRVFRQLSIPDAKLWRASLNKSQFRMDISLID